MKILLTLILAFVLNLYFFSKNHSINISKSYKKLKCNLKLNKRVFKLGESLFVQFQVKNTNYDSIKITISKRFYYNFSFLIKSLKNEIIGEKNYFYAEKVDNKEKPDNFDIINIGYNQFYGQAIDLTRYYKLNKSGHYLIQGFFNPVPQNIRKSVQIPTQIIQIELQPIFYYRKEEIESKKKIESEKLGKIISPNNIVEFTLNAQMNKNWKNYFRYIDLTNLIKQYPKFYKRYLLLRPGMRTTIINEFKEFLKTYIYEFGIKSIKDFKIYKSIIENDRKQARILVHIQYLSDGFLFYRKYTFNLYQKNIYWYIYSWQVENVN